jgi:hypothetical protein
MSLQLITADDSSLMFSSTNPLEIEARLNLDLHALDNWVKQWLVDFNPSHNSHAYSSNGKI